MVNFPIGLTDLFIPVGLKQKSSAFVNGKKKVICKSEESEFEVLEIHKFCEDLNLSSGEDNYLKFKDVNFRVHKERRVNGDIFCLRMLKSFIPSLTKTNPEGVRFPTMFAELVDNHSKHRGGLYMITGALGVGKTTAAAAVLDHLLRTIGGMAWTLEDPPEYCLEGEYGEDGLCFQHPVKNGDFSQSIRSLMRAFPAGCPSILFVGEIRDQETAQEVLHMLLNGAVVIFTYHSGSAIEAITRFSTVTGGQVYSKEILAESIRLIVGISSTSNENAGTSLKFEFLEGTDSLKSAIKSNNLNSLQDVKIRQQNQRAIKRKEELRS
jgi:twitching motility protein PilT